MSNSSSSSNGIGIFGATFLVFLVLKLTNHVDWSWFWVTSPLWIGFSLAIILISIFVLVFARNG